MNKEEFSIFPTWCIQMVLVQKVFIASESTPTKIDTHVHSYEECHNRECVM